MKTYECIVRITDDCKPKPLCMKDLKTILTDGTRNFSGVSIRVNAIQELPEPEEETPKSGRKRGSKGVTRKK